MYRDYTTYDPSTGEITGRVTTRKEPVQPSIPGVYSPDTHKVVGGKPLKRSTQEVTQRASEASRRNMRIDRDSFLLSSDWTQMPDSPLSEQERQQWAAYRQQLRDLPDNTPDPLNVTWPEPPTRGKRP